ncbi:MAG: hypothetical protein LBT83_09490 [Tannerella sp.]|nr:hypothetical protein [Tannerella sp.]
MKNRFIKGILSSLPLWMACILTSCLTAGLEDLPAFEEAEITDVRFEFRYKDASAPWIDGEPMVRIVNLTTQNRVIDTNAATITCALQVPAAADAFTEAVRGQVSLASLAGKFNLSTAAVIAPVEGAPVLGIPGDFSGPRKYKVTAADGTTKTWTVHVTGLNK